MTTKYYPDIEANPNFAALEQEILKFWAENRTFEQSVAQRPATKRDGSSNAYVFYDGPPFANGSPHYGHLLTGYVKDAIARYHTMRGARVERRFGWDCHGLPAEMGAEKELGISGRAQIINYGIDKFNAHCRTSVMKYVGDWRYYVTRQGRWVDFDNDYKTMDTPYMESVLWAFSELYKKGLIYESMRVMPYSWAAETPVSNFETRIDNATREREDKAAYVKFKFKESIGKTAASDFLVAWTTTPWTLPANLALAVSKSLDYLPVIEGDARLWLETNAAFALAKQSAVKDKIETARCVMRPFTSDDLPLVLKLHQHPEVAKTTYDGMESDEKIAAHLADFIAHQKEHGYSQWAVFDRASGEFIGRCGVTKRQLDPARAAQLEIRCAFLPDYWHGGIASECCYAWLMRSFATQPIEMMVGAAHPSNARSHQMMERLGYVFEKNLAMQIGEGPYFVLTREAFIAANARNGVDLLGLTYEPLFPYFADTPNAFRILDGSAFVTEGDGTGIVHMAPGFGEVDQKCCAENGIDVIVPVDGQGKYTDEIFDLPDLKLRGLNVIADQRLEAADSEQHIAEKDVQKYGLVNMRIIRWLKAHGALVKDERVLHNYPHCWRTDTPLIYRAMSSWYVDVQAIKQNMVENNQTIHWIPDHVKDGQMGRGIESAPDWSISRNRFWGTPIPIWRSTNPDSKEPLKVFGSIAELEKFFGVKVPDLHRPFIDDLKAPDPSGGEYIRVADVFDCWFESGSMPYAQVHYPFENKDWFEENFPADFITEYIAQTRGWFYTLQVLSAALFGKAPFKNVICHGVVIDEETGLKYSKRLKNYKDPKEVMDSYGADALRWMMLASPVMRGSDLGVDPDGKFIRDVVRLNIKPMWSAFNFFTLYANADGVKAKRITASENILDRYILAKARSAVEQMRASLDAYDTPGATEAITAFFDVLNNWYIRRSRPRFWGSEMTADKQSAYDTLFTVIELMCLVSAPLLPFVSEAVYRGLNGADASVHLQDFPEVSKIDQAEQLIADIDWTRDICNAGSAIRNRKSIRNRQPLSSLTIYGEIEILKRLDEKNQTDANLWEYLKEVIKDELNVKEVQAVTQWALIDKIGSRKLIVNAREVGKRLPQKMKEILSLAKAGSESGSRSWNYSKGSGVMIASVRLIPENNEYTIVWEIKPEYKETAHPSKDNIVVLDTTITPELEAEGRARDLVRMIQQARKDAGLNVGDRITLGLDVPVEFQSALATHGDYIASQTLAVSWREGSADAVQKMKQELDGAEFIIGISRAA